MVTTLSKLVEMIQRGAIPAWVRDYVETNRDVIATELREKGIYVLKGPGGVQVRIETDKRAAAA